MGVRKYDIHKAICQHLINLDKFKNIFTKVCITSTIFKIINWLAICLYITFRRCLMTFQAINNVLAPKYTKRTKVFAHTKFIT